MLIIVSKLNAPFSILLKLIQNPLIVARSNGLNSDFFPIIVVYSQQYADDMYCEMVIHLFFCIHRFMIKKEKIKSGVKEYF